MFVRETSTKVSFATVSRIPFVLQLLSSFSFSPSDRSPSPSCCRVVWISNGIPPRFVRTTGKARRRRLRGRRSKSFERKDVERTRTGNGNVRLFRLEGSPEGGEEEDAYLCVFLDRLAWQEGAGTSSRSQRARASSVGRNRNGAASNRGWIPLPRESMGMDRR